MNETNLINSLNNAIFNLVKNNKLNKKFVKYLTLLITKIIDNHIKRTKLKHYKFFPIDLYNIFLQVNLKKGKQILYNKIDCAILLVKLIMTKHTLVKQITCDEIVISINRMHYYRLRTKQQFRHGKKIINKIQKNINKKLFEISTKIYFCFEATKIYDNEGYIIPEATRMFKPNNFTGKFNNYRLHIQQSPDDFVVYILMRQHGDDVIPITCDNMKDWFLTGRYYKQFKHRVSDYSVKAITFEL